VKVDRGRQGALRVVRQERRDFERHPAVHAIGPGKDRLEQVGGTGQIRKSQREEQILGRFAVDAERETSSSYMSLFLIALSKIVGFEVSPVTERSSM
jgi:hypothetical protein